VQKIICLSGSISTAYVGTGAALKRPLRNNCLETIASGATDLLIAVKNFLLAFISYMGKNKDVGRIRRNLPYF
jgi:hypothetical protein